MQKVNGHPLNIKDFHRFKTKGFKFFSYSFGFFSPFPHGTHSLSNHKKGLGFEGGPPIFKQTSLFRFTHLNLLILFTGLTPSLVEVS
jgi:hypothetical protein